MDDTVVQRPMRFDVADPGASPDGQRLERLEFQGEHLRILTKEERVVSDQPVLLVRGRNRITAGSLDWSERDRVANLRGRVQAVLPGRQPP